ncbi:MAG TPA: DUF4197 domain-containing protein [Saprospiraceae bacterium]|nr:DUF4197 domain-containing protein [Saprospiraceae bacterium]
MKKAYFSIFTAVIISILLSFPCDSHAQLKDILNKAKQTVLPSDDGEIGLGLKQALEFGVNEAVEKLSSEKGYLESPYKILIPEEARQIIAKVKMVPGFQDVEKQLIDKMNKAAELAAKKATPIFVEAITDMTFKDAMNILLGEHDAATQYLETNTRIQLYNLFLPVIQSALDEVNARTYWTSVMNAYNSIPFVKKVNPALDDHVNNKALDGLFSLIEVKEAKIRGDQSERKTDLLKKVFAKQDKG